MFTRIETIQGLLSQVKKDMDTNRDTKTSLQMLLRLRYLLEEECKENENYNKTTQYKDFHKSVCEQLAVAYFYLGEFQKAREEVTAIKLHYQGSYISTILLGHIHYNECEYAKALRMYETALLQTNNNNADPHWQAVVYRSLGYALYRSAQQANDADAEKINKEAEFAFQNAIDIFKRIESTHLEFALAKHGYGRLLAQMNRPVDAEQMVLEALVSAMRICENEKDNYDVAIIKRTYAVILLNNGKKICQNPAARYLTEALATQMAIHKDIPHQAIIGTMKEIVDAWIQFPENTIIAKMIPTIANYLNKWDKLVESAQHKHQLNVTEFKVKVSDLIDKINKTQNKYAGQFSIWNPQVQKAAAATAVAVIGGAIAYTQFKP